MFRVWRWLWRLASRIALEWGGVKRNGGADGVAMAGGREPVFVAGRPRGKCTAARLVNIRNAAYYMS
jgi:hypothetical protein